MFLHRFEPDETNPSDDVYEQFDYTIASKMNKRKIEREEKEEAARENSGCTANCC